MGKTNGGEVHQLHIRLSASSMDFLEQYRAWVRVHSGADLSWAQTLEAIVQRARSSGWAAEPK